MKNLAASIFKLRVPLLSIFAILTVFFIYRACQLEVATDFSNMIPQNHEYMKNYEPHKSIFGGGNEIKVEVSRKDKTILDKYFLEKLVQITEDVMFVKGVDRLTINTLISPETMFVRVTEEGYEMDRIVPPNIPDSPEAMDNIMNMIVQAGLLGRMVSMDLKAVMITGNIYESGVDYLRVYRELNQIRDKYSDDDISIHINGFAMVVGFVRDALPKIFLMFGLTCIITILILWQYFRRFWSALLPLLSGAVSVAWGLGISQIIGLKLDPMTTIVPFLIFSIGVSHGIQMLQRYLEECANFEKGYDAALRSLEQLMVPGVVAMVTDAIGFFTIVMVPIGMIRDLALSASIGIASIIVANIFGLTLTLSFFPNQLKAGGKTPKDKPESIMSRLLTRLSALTWGKNAYIVTTVSFVLLISSFLLARTMTVGDVNPGEPLLWEDSVYNQDAKKMMTDFLLGVDTLSIVVAGDEAGTCKNSDVLQIMEEFEWELAHIPGVTAVLSPLALAKTVNEMIHEGDIRWRSLPKATNELAYLFASAGSVRDTIFMDMGCQNMNIRIFLSDHKGNTIREVIRKANEFIADHPLPEGHRFVLAGSNAGVMAATNEEVDSAQEPMLFWVYFSVFMFCLVFYRSFKAPLFILLPLFIVSIMSDAFMRLFGLGLNVNTLPVAALGVGIGVDYGIYMYSRLLEEKKKTEDFSFISQKTLHTTGAAILFNASAKTVGVLTWLMSDLKFQADMGVLMAFIYIANFFGALILLPALVYIFDIKHKKNTV